MSQRFANLANTYTNSVLVSTPTGVLLRLYCPVIARVRSPVNGYGKGDQVSITAIHESHEGKLCYMVDGTLLSHRHFELLTIKSNSI
jgi:hypothetical protein